MVALKGFNEAPIHESGKLCFRSERRGASLSFNEAPIHESGKLHFEVSFTTEAYSLQ